MRAYSKFLLKKFDECLADHDKRIRVLEEIDARKKRSISVLEEAVKNCNDAIDNNAKNGYAYYYRGYANALLKNSMDAKNDYKNAKMLGCNLPIPPSV